MSNFSHITNCDFEQFTDYDFKNFPFINNIIDTYYNYPISNLLTNHNHYYYFKLIIKLLINKKYYIYCIHSKYNNQHIMYQSFSSIEDLYYFISKYNIYSKYYYIRIFYAYSFSYNQRSTIANFLHIPIYFIDNYNYKTIKHIFL